jgi:hypothetical protein
VGGLVIDAPLAAGRTEFAEAAAIAGVPAFVDPLTFGLQIDPSPSSTFAELPYSSHASVDPSVVQLRHMADQVIDFQLRHGATAITLPYFHVRDLTDGWAPLTLGALEAGARARDAMALQLSSIAILSGNRRSLSSEAGLVYVDRFVARALDLGVSAIAVCVSPAGQPSDSYDSVARSAAVIERASKGGLPTIAWRQGVYGLAFSALGADGYECGIGQGESSDIASAQTRMRAHEPLADDDEFRRPKRSIYFPSWQRSIPNKAARVLLNDPVVQGEVLCEVPGCCPTTTDTISRQRHHAVRARAHQLAEQSKQPEQWRIQHLLQGLDSARGTARRANEVLKNAGVAYRVPVDNLSAQIDYLTYKRDLNQGRRSA